MHSPSCKNSVVRIIAHRHSPPHSQFFTTQYIPGIGPAPTSTEYLVPEGRVLGGLKNRGQYNFLHISSLSGKLFGGGTPGRSSTEKYLHINATYQRWAFSEYHSVFVTNNLVLFRLWTGLTNALALIQRPFGCN